MSVRESYNHWSASYDEVENKTRDLELIAGKLLLGSRKFERIIEIGCGTGKNTEWLSRITNHLISIDFSEGMLKQARAKITAPHVEFLQADITKPWPINKNANLISFSLVLEHVKDLDDIMHQSAIFLKPGGLVYICELHPFKQYNGSKARFETAEGVSVLECYTHHVSDYSSAALKHGFSIIDLQEWFDGDDKQSVPRLLSLLLLKS